MTVRPRWQRILDKALLAMVVLFALSQIFIWGLWENPSMGDSLRYLIMQSQVILSVLCILLWWFTIAPVSRSVRLGVGLPVLLLIAGGIASIRSFELTGDMRVVIDYRWNPSRREILTRQAGTSTTIEMPIESIPVVQPEDMPAYRGVQRDGVVIGPPLAQVWTQESTPELWRLPAGGGYASIAIVEPLAVTIEQQEKEEAIVCFDTVTGRQHWEFRYPAYFSEAMGGIGPRSTPTFDGDVVFTWGAFGDLFCLDLKTGKPKWHVNSLQQFGVPNTHWAMTSSPLIDEDRVIVNIGGMKGNGLIAYSKADGKLVWHGAGIQPVEPAITKFETGEKAVQGLSGFSVPGYASPEIRTVLGEQIILNFDGKGLRGHDRQTGKQLFFFPFENDANVNVAQPIVIDDGRIFLSVSYDTGCAMVQIARTGEEWSASQIWSNKQMRCKFTSPVLHESYLYGLDEGILVCLDPATGKRMWKGGSGGLKGRYYHGQLLLTNGQIVASTEDGQMVLVQPNPEKLIEVTSMRVLPKGKNWNPPALVRGKLYVRNSEEIACFDLNAHQEQSTVAHGH